MIILELIKEKKIQLDKWFRQQATFKFTLMLGFAIFLFSFWLISRNNGFFSGDMGVMGLIIDDMSKGNFYSWYFYGQNYFGNLEPIILIPLTFFTGNSINSLYFWEYFFFFVSILFLILSWVKRNRFQTLIVYLILFFSIRHIFPFTYYPQGFAFVSMIILGFYFLFKNIYVDKIKINNWHFMLVAFGGAISIWHNLLVAIICPIFFILVLNKIISKKYNLNLKDFLFGLFGALIGLVPFVLATIQTSSENLNWFIDNTDSDKLYSIYYVGRDFFFYFLNPSLVNSDNLSNIIQGVLLVPRNFLGVIFLIFSLILIVKYYIQKEKFLVDLSFLFFLLLLLISKDYMVGSYIFYHIRYAVPFYTLFIFLIVYVSFKYIAERKCLYFLKIISLYTLSFLILLVPITVYKRYTEANSYPQFYENIYNIVYYKYYSRNLYCDNYYDVCATIAYLGKDSNFNVQLINTNDSNEYRNPRGIGKVDESLQKGESVMSLIREDKLKKSHIILEEFSMVPGATVYYLIEGDYK